MRLIGLLLTGVFPRKESSDSVKRRIKFSRPVKLWLVYEKNNNNLFLLTLEF